MSYEYFGLISFVLLVIGLLIVVNKWPKSLNYTFSQHVADNKTSIVYYQLLFLFTLPLLLLYLMKWLVPTYNLGYWFSMFAILAVVFQISCTFVPETGGRQTKIHQSLAYLSAGFLFIPIVIMALNASLPLGSKIFSYSAALSMAGITFALLLSHGKHKKLLLLQSLYYFVFFMAILSPMIFK